MDANQSTLPHDRSPRELDHDPQWRPASRTRAWPMPLVPALDEGSTFVARGSFSSLTTAAVVIRPFEPASDNRIERIIARVVSLSEPEIELLLEDVMREFHSRHQRTQHFFRHRFSQLKKYLLTDQPLSESRQMLIGAYFTQEYALESAALFNPSMVWHPDQSNVEPGTRRFLSESARHGRGAHLVDHLPQRHDRRQEQASAWTSRRGSSRRPSRCPTRSTIRRCSSRKLVELGDRKLV